MSETNPYSALHAGEIRLLSLLSGSSAQEIQCRLIPCLLENAKFEALSYSWGDCTETEKRTITVNGKCVRVTKNLWIALQHLRDEFVDRVLWIDALCINQIDDEEKCVQIEKMRDIYHTASDVLVWLGDAGEDSDQAMRLVDRMSDENVVGLYLQDHQAWAAMVKLFRRAWWGRCWVLQEVAMASSEPVVICGSTHLPWSKFRAVHDRLMLAVSGKEFLIIPPDHPIWSVSIALSGFIVTEVRRNDWESDLGWLLRHTMSSQATDPRDKVYSLLGLASPKDRASVKPDYTKSVRQTFMDTAQYIFGADLYHINNLCFRTNSPFHSLPSWTPDWSLSTGNVSLWIWDAYKACGDSQPEMHFDGAAGVMKVAGVVFDEISHHDTKSRPETSFTQYGLEVIRSIESLLEDVVTDSPASLLSGLLPSRSDALWRTLVADRSFDTTADFVSMKCPAPENYGQKYEVYCGRERVPDEYMSGSPLATREECFVYPLVDNFKLFDQRFFITKGGRLGLGPLSLQVGDLVVILLGADMPFILRKRGNRFTLLGCAYVHGIMHGGFFKSRANSSSNRFKFFKSSAKSLTKVFRFSKSGADSSRRFFELV